jgi:hypothetical protein
MSSELGLVVVSQRTDHIGSVDYALTEIRRDEPPAKLFEIPAGYTLVQGAHIDDPLIEFEAWTPKALCAGRTR